MRENRPSGSEGGGGQSSLPTPIRLRLCLAIPLKTLDPRWNSVNYPMYGGVLVSMGDQNRRMHTEKLVTRSCKQRVDANTELAMAA